MYSDVPSCPCPGSGEAATPHCVSPRPPPAPLVSVASPFLKKSGKYFTECFSSRGCRMFSQDRTGILDFEEDCTSFPGVCLTNVIIIGDGQRQCLPGFCAVNKVNSFLGTLVITSQLLIPHLGWGAD